MTILQSYPPLVAATGQPAQRLDLPRLDGTKTTRPDVVAEALRTHGAVIVEHLVPPTVDSSDDTDLSMDQLRDDLDACDGWYQGQPGSFAGPYTSRNAGKPLGESRVAQRLATHPLILHVIRQRLGPWCKRFVLGTCSAIDVEQPSASTAPAVRHQELVREI